VIGQFLVGGITLRITLDFGSFFHWSDLQNKMPMKPGVMTISFYAGRRWATPFNHYDVFTVQ